MHTRNKTDPFSCSIALQCDGSIWLPSHLMYCQLSAQGKDSNLLLPEILIRSYEKLIVSTCLRSSSLCKTIFQINLEFFIVLGFNDTSTLVGHFVSSPRERKKRDRRDSRGRWKRGRRKKEEQEWKGRNRSNKNSPLFLTCYHDSRPCPTVSQYQLDAPVT